MSNIGLRLTASSSRAARAAWSTSRRIHARDIHHRKELSYPVENGLGDFLSPEALKMVAIDYQNGLLDRLNDQVRGTDLENKSVVQTVISAARDPNKVLAFNYASEALNNSFFLETLKPLPDGASSHVEALTGTAIKQRIAYDYGNVEHLISTVGAAALGMFSSGWIWLVTDKRGNLAVLPTFGTGTLLVRSSQGVLPPHWQSTLGSDDYAPAPPDFSAPKSTPPAESQSEPAPSSPASTASAPPPSSPVSGTAHSAPPIHPPAPSRTFATSSLLQDSALGAANSIYQAGYAPSVAIPTSGTPPDSKDPSRMGEYLFPLFCLSVHERMWVGGGYGVWGKEEYVKRFFTVLDWKKVEETFRKFAPSPGSIDADLHRAPRS